MSEYYGSTNNGNINAILQGQPRLDRIETKNIIELFNPKSDAWLESIYVTPTKNGKGEGTILLDGLVEICKELGIRRIVGILVPFPGFDENKIKQWYINRGFRIETPSTSYEYVVLDLDYADWVEP